MVRRIVRAALFAASFAALAVTARLATLPRAVDLHEATALAHAEAFARGTPAYTEPAVQGAPNAPPAAASFNTFRRVRSMQWLPLRKASPPRDRSRAFASENAVLYGA